MTSNMRRSIVLLAVTFLYGIAAHGSTIYDESVSGDLSSSGSAPTLLTVSLGANDVFGTTGKTGTTIDRDYFTFTVPLGDALTGITVLPGTLTLGAGSDSFIGVEIGPKVTLDPANSPDATGLLGWFHYNDTTDIGSNILPSMGTSGDNSTGFHPGPLPAGTYSIWDQEASAGTVPYGLEFTIAPTPEPASWTMLLTGMALIMGKTVRRGARSGA